MTGFDDNDLFMMMGEAEQQAEPKRQMGYYVCSVMQRGCGSDFLKAIPKPKQPCPFCGRMANRALIMDPVEVLLQKMIWQESDVYSALRADEKTA